MATETLAEFCDRREKSLTTWAQTLSGYVNNVIPEGGGTVQPIEPQLARYVRSCAAGLVDEIQSVFVMLRACHCKPAADTPAVVEANP